MMASEKKIYNRALITIAAFSLLLFSGCTGKSETVGDRLTENFGNLAKTLSTNHILMVDISPSMGPYLPAVRNSIANAIRSASSDDVISVYGFWHLTLPVIENIRVGDWDREQLVATVTSKVQVTDGCTDVAQMLEFAKTKMSNSEKLFPYHRKMLLIFSDNQHAPYPCGGNAGKKLSPVQLTDLEQKSSSIRRMGGWSKFVIYTPEVNTKETSYNKLPTEIGAKRIEYTDYKRTDSLNNLFLISKWLLITQMFTVFFIFIYFLFRIYFLSRILFSIGLFLFILSTSIFLLEMLAGVDYLNTSIEAAAGFLVNYVSPYIGDHRLILPLQFSVSSMIYFLIFLSIKRLTKIKSPKAKTI